MLFKVLLAAVSLSVVLTQDVDFVAVNFDCVSMIPFEKTEADAGEDQLIRFNFSPDHFTAGEQLRVTISRSDGRTFNAFMVQARRPTGTFPEGTWLPDGPVRLNICGQNNIKHDTVLVEPRQRGTEPAEFNSVELTWMAPDQPGLGKIEFVVTLVNEDINAETQEFWMGNSYELHEMHADL